MFNYCNVNVRTFVISLPFRFPLSLPIIHQLIIVRSDGISHFRWCTWLITFIPAVHDTYFIQVLDCAMRYVVYTYELYGQESSLPSVIPPVHGDTLYLSSNPRSIIDNTCRLSSSPSSSFDLYLSHFHILVKVDFNSNPPAMSSAKLTFLLLNAAAAVAVAPHRRPRLSRGCQAVSDIPRRYFVPA